MVVSCFRRIRGRSIRALESFDDEGSPNETRAGAEVVVLVVDAGMAVVAAAAGAEVSGQELAAADLTGVAPHVVFL